MARISSGMLDPEWPFDKSFAPIAKQVGFLLRDVNDLQDLLKVLFMTFVPSLSEEMVNAIWHAVTNDRMQRAILLRAAEAGLPFDSPRLPTELAKANKHIYEEIKWIVERANSLSQQRDAAAHAPVAPVIESAWTWIAHVFSGHPRAKDLQGKPLLKEFRLYRERAATLYRYAHEWEFYLGTDRHLRMPQRPQWPDHPLERRGKTRQVQGGPKARKRLPPSSPA